MTSQWCAGRFALSLDRPLVMGIVNITPDSFSDGGQAASTESALRHADALVAQGADILDLGAESTRPGAPPVSLDEELDRLIPVVRSLLTWNIPVSVDTYKPEVMRRCLDLGVDIINDVWALRRVGAGGLKAEDVVVSHPHCGVCLMHMHREPLSMQVAPMEGDPVPAVASFLAERARRLVQQGVSPDRIVLDYGIGFGKTVEQNFALLARQSELLSLGFPLLAGWSRKSSLGQVTGQSVAGARVVSSVTAAVLAVERGARIVRVHDVAQTVEALAVWQAVAAQAR